MGKGTAGAEARFPEERPTKYTAELRARHRRQGRPYSWEPSLPGARHDPREPSWGPGRTESHHTPRRMLGGRAAPRRLKLLGQSARPESHPGPHRRGVKEERPCLWEAVPEAPSLALPAEPAGCHEVSRLTEAAGVPPTPAQQGLCLHHCSTPALMFFPPFYHRTKWCPCEERLETQGRAGSPPGLRVKLARSPSERGRGQGRRPMPAGMGPVIYACCTDY